MSNKLLIHLVQVTISKCKAGNTVITTHNTIKTLEISNIGHYRSLIAINMNKFNSRISDIITELNNCSKMNNNK